MVSIIPELMLVVDWSSIFNCPQLSWVSGLWLVLSFAHNFSNSVSRALAPGALILLFALSWSVVVPCGWKREMGLRSRGEEGGRGNPFFLWVFGPGVPILFCLHFSYCYLPVSNLYLADGFYSFFLQFCLSYCSQGAHSRIFLFYPSFLFCLLGVEVYFWFWLTRVCFSVGFSRLSGIYFLVGFSRLSACLEHTIYRWCPSGFTLHSFPARDLSSWSTPPSCVFACPLIS